MTKTDANTERDDRCEVNHILELITKTNVELERYDNGDPTFRLDTRYYTDCPGSASCCYLLPAVVTSLWIMLWLSSVDVVSLSCA
ncbi:hypothetical protein ALQ47_200049 [Pseudomonas cichorii]|nr:hypothetical protein ALQ47_200049 [Pseudomonas cichorii]